MTGQVSTRPSAVVVTGASGFIGRAILAAARNHYHVYALARRSQTQAGVPEHRNIEWFIVDITDRQRLDEVFSAIAESGGADFILHLAGYYSFENTDEPEYELTNVLGTRNVLEVSRKLNPRRFVFASSLVVSEPPENGSFTTESSPADATFPYARSKAAGERLVREHSRFFPCSTVRLAATFSDWCEYGPFYMLLSTWLDRGWDARILAGRGSSAQPFVHIDQVVEFFLSLFEHTDSLKHMDTYLIASREVYSHRSLYETATRLCFGHVPPPVFIPVSLAALGIALRDAWGRLTGKRPFERLWMVRYIDRQFRADDRYTRTQIPLRANPRLSLQRRFAYMLENRDSHPVQWHERNQDILRKKRTPPNAVIASAMSSRREDILNTIVARLKDPHHASTFPRHRQLDERKLRWQADLTNNLLMSSVQHRDRMALLSYARYLASTRKSEGFGVDEVKNALAMAGSTVLASLQSAPELKGMEQLLSDSLRLTLELAVDEIEAVYETDGEPAPRDSYHVLIDATDWPILSKRHFLQSVIDSIEESIIVIDRDYRVRMMNRHAHDLHVGIEPVFGPLHCYELTHHLDRPCSGKEHPCPLKQVMGSGEAARVQHTHFDRDGNPCDVEVLASPLLDEQGEIAGIIETTHRIVDQLNRGSSSGEFVPEA
jgi:nucleoside-diphosphate-sugar epimerase